MTESGGKPRHFAPYLLFFLAGILLALVAVGLVFKKIANQMIHGLVPPGTERTCYWWKPINWSNWMPKTLEGANERATYVFAANCLKYTYQKACREVEGTFPNVQVVDPPASLDIVQWIYAIDRNQPEVFGFAATYQNFLVLTFRGTMVANNWISDFHFDQKKWLGDTLVHQGFLKVAQTTFAQIDDLLAKFPDKQLFITGHSLGAGMAGIVSSYIWWKTQGKRYIKTIVYGCPRTGNPAFAEHFSRAIDGYNVQNLADITVDVPIALTPNLRGKKPYSYQHWDKVITFTLDLGSVPYNHHIENYLKAVETFPQFSGGGQHAQK